MHFWDKTTHGTILHINMYPIFTYNSNEIQYFKYVEYKINYEIVQTASQLILVIDVSKLLSLVYHSCWIDTIYMCYFIYKVYCHGM